VPGRRPEPVAGRFVRDVREQEKNVSGNGTLKSFKAMLAEAKLPENIVPTCLRNDLKAEHEQLNEELELLEKKAPDSLAGNGGADLAERITELEEQMRESTYPIRLRALPKPEYRAFVSEFPPRMDDEGKVSYDLDGMYGFNTELGFEPLVRRSIVDPELDDAEFAELMTKLTDNQFNSLGIAAWMLNRGDIDVPFSRAASRLTRLTADVSKPPTD
jgi:hypothetical protein